MEEAVFYYVRGSGNEPVITICLKQQNDYFLRGISICSAQDTPCKEAGRSWAGRRVLRAERISEKKGTHFKTDYINLDSEKITKSMDKFGWDETRLPFDHKTYCIPPEELTDFERRLLVKS